MAAKREHTVRRKLIEFDEPTWQTLDLLARDSMTTWQELADEAFRDLLKKHGRPTDLRAALRESARSREPRNDNKPDQKKPNGNKPKGKKKKKR